MRNRDGDTDGFESLQGGFGNGEDIVFCWKGKAAGEMLGETLQGLFAPVEMQQEFGRQRFEQMRVTREGIVGYRFVFPVPVEEPRGRF